MIHWLEYVIHDHSIPSVHLAVCIKFPIFPGIPIILYVYIYIHIIIDNIIHLFLHLNPTCSTQFEEYLELSIFWVDLPHQSISLYIYIDIYIYQSSNFLKEFVFGDDLFLGWNDISTASQMFTSLFFGIPGNGPLVRVICTCKFGTFAHYSPPATPTTPATPATPMLRLLLLEAPNPTPTSHYESLMTNSCNSWSCVPITRHRITFQK